MNKTERLAEARRFAKRMRQQMTYRRHKALLNTDKSKDLNHEYMEKVIEYFSGLKKRGFRTTDENEPGVPGRIVPITRQWVKEQLAKETATQKLQRKKGLDTRHTRKYHGKVEGR